MNKHSYSCCKPSTEESKYVSSLSNILKLVSEESRLKILCILRQGSHCVYEIMKHLDMSQSLISHHLKDLKEMGILQDEKRGVRVYYSYTEKGKTITDLLFQIPMEINL